MSTYEKSEAKAYARRHLRGAISAICMPERDGEIDEPGLRADIRHCLDVIDAQGIYIHGFYGNFWLLTSAERRRGIEVAVDEVGGVVPVVCRCAHASLREAIELAQHAEAAGADLISLLGPAMGQGSEEMVLRWFTELAAASNLGLSVFNTTQAGYVMSPELLARISEIENVAALKNHLPLAHTNEVRRLVGDSIVVIDPDEETFLDSILNYGQQAIYTGTNYMFDGQHGTPMRGYIEAALAGDAELARQLFDALQPLRDVHHRWVSIPWEQQGICPVATVKWWSEIRGMTGGSVRAPLIDLEPNDRAALEQDVEAATRKVVGLAV